MPTNVKVIHPSDFLRARPDGHADLETAQHLLEGIAEAAAPLEHYQVLIDMRDVVGMLNPGDLYDLAASLLKYRETFMHKTAMLCPRERFDHVKLFSLLAASHGFVRMRAFLTYEDAMEWLLQSA
jgi:hypothetical protein